MLEPREHDRYARQLAAMTRAAGRDDPEAFAAVVALIDRARSVLLPEAAAALRAQTGVAGGYSWGDIARALGVARQSATERFGPHTKATVPESADPPLFCGEDSTEGPGICGLPVELGCCADHGQVGP